MLRNVKKIIFKRDSWIFKINFIVGSAIRRQLFTLQLKVILNRF